MFVLISVPFSLRRDSVRSFADSRFLLCHSSPQAPDSAAAAKPPPPPPSRSQTVSPSRAHRPPSSLSAGPSSARLDGAFPTGGPPPSPGSARLDGSSAPHSRFVSAPSTRPPTGPPSRASSSTGISAAAAPPPPSGGAAPPPAVGKPGDPPRSVSVPPFRGPVVDQTAELMARTPTPGAGGSAAARKKNLRSRYVSSPPLACLERKRMTDLLSPSLFWFRDAGRRVRANLE